MAPDPEDAQLSTLQMHPTASDEARLRIEERALRVGLLGAMGDDHGAVIAITADSSSTS